MTTRRIAAAFAIFVQCAVVVTAERPYENLEFTTEKCLELGYATDDFEVCAVIEFCTSDDDERSRKLLLLLQDASGSGSVRRRASEELTTFQEEVEEAEVEQAHAQHEDHDVSTKNKKDEEEWTETASLDEEEQPPPPQQRPTNGHISSNASTASPPPNVAQYGWRLEGSTTCSYPGPIMRLKRGSNHGLFVRGADGVKTNLHFHGLHVAGASHPNGDDMYRSVEGSDNTMIYALNMPADQHHGGTHWYHSHMQGASWEQVKGGAFGMIVVDDNGHDVGTDDPNVLEFLSQEKIMVLDNSHDFKSWRANGLAHEETYDFIKDEWYRLRILAVNAESHRDQEIIAFSSDNCQVHALAHDGIFRFEVPKPDAQSEFLLTSSSRLDVAIRCSANAEITVGKDTVATIKVDSTSSSSAATPFESGTDTWQSARLEYTKDLRHVKPHNWWTAHIDETNINGIGARSHKPLCDDDGNDFTFGTVQSIELRGAATHPFHIHMYPMQVVSKGGACGDGHEAGEFYDTVVTSGGSGNRPCMLRLNLVDVAGPATVHCHIFQHAEQGALGYFNVEGGPEADGVDGPSCMEGSTCTGSKPLAKCSDDPDDRLLRRKS
jgi:FtsP/CotA-like multicopper oxidase with cupredoxin domain